MGKDIVLRVFESGSKEVIDSDDLTPEYLEKVRNSPKIQLGKAYKVKRDKLRGMGYDV